MESGWAAAQRDPHAGVALFNGASVLIKANRNPALAIKLLEAYLAAPRATEEAPAVHRARVAGAAEGASRRHRRRTPRTGRGAGPGAGIQACAGFEAVTVHLIRLVKIAAHSAIPFRRSFRRPPCCALAPGALSAQVSLGTVVDLAQRNSTAVRLAEADVRKAQAVLSESKDVFVPSLDVQHRASGVS